MNLPSSLPLERLLTLRWAAIAGQSLAILMAVRGFGLPLSLDGLFAVCLFLGAINLFSHWRLTFKTPVGHGEFFAQLCVDVAGLSLLLYQAGGSSNPFVSLLLVPLTIAATLLPLAWVGGMALVTAAAYSALLTWNIPLPPPRMEWSGLNDLVCSVTGIDRSLLSHDNGFSLHVVGMWVNFLLSAAIITVFISRLASQLRRREHELAQAREGVLRQEQILALGTLAAGAAHQLGTPLSTMAVVLRELQLDHGQNASLAPDLNLLRDQVDRCKAILAQLVERAAQADAKTATPLAGIAERLLDEWRLLRPGIPVTCETKAMSDAIVVVDGTLDQALLNLLNNAADANAASGACAAIELRTGRDGDDCYCEILDRGPGISHEAAQRIGEAFFTTKSDATDDTVGGLGIGLFLSNASIERLGGRVEIFNREGGGARTRVTLPCSPKP
ncbi:MAG TPA: ATP-binding protein [Rhodocyclaceae bacterium]|nr:ATP-binding protein [Rhodocyclaceae bacterium]